MARPPKPRTDFSSRLVSARGGIPREEFARRLQVPKSTLGNWELGATTPPLDMLVRMAEELKVSLDWLIAGRTEGGSKGAGAAAAIGGGHGPEPVPPATALDERLMATLAQGIAVAFQNAGVPLPPDRLGLELARLYSEIVAATDGPEDHPGAVKICLARLGRDLRKGGA